MEISILTSGELYLHVRGTRDLRIGFCLVSLDRTNASPARSITELVCLCITGIGVSVGTLALVAYGITQGDWGDFIQQWQTSRFIHVMSLDFCVLCLSFPALLGDDMARRGVKSPLLFWISALIPLFGPLIYLCLRPPLPEASSDSSPLSQGV